VREQAVVQKVGNRSGFGGGRRSSSAQKPSRRERGQGASFSERARVLLGYVPTILKVTAAIAIGVVLFLGYRAAAAASFFQIRNVEIQGTSRASAEGIEDVVRRQVSKTGVWNADLTQLNAALKQMPWIRSAVVSRVLPDGIRVRVVERVPRAVVRASTGRFSWVDEDAVFLGEMGPSDQVPPFFLRGLSEEDSEAAHHDNLQRVSKFLDLQRECEAVGITDRISEINVADLHDVRVQLAGEDSQIEVRLGANASGKRLSDGLTVLDEHRKQPRGHLISYVDLSHRKGAAIGFISGPQQIAPREEGEKAGSDDTKRETPKATARSSPEKEKAKRAAR
jgi:cell division septal protein FtsQ